MPKYRKKPVVIDAIQFTGRNYFDGVYQFANRDREVATLHVAAPQAVIRIKTLEGTMTASVGDWIIRGVKGEIYPCKPDNFEATYEPIE